MLYDLSNILDRERYKRRTAELYEKKAIVEVKEKTSRSTSQNRYLHLLLGYLAIETGNTLEYVKEQFYKRAANPGLYLMTKEDKLLGEVAAWTRSSADLTKEEMTVSITRLRDWASQVAGIYLPSADEQGFLQMIELEMSKQQRYI
jgi:hypothetical protein